MTSTNSSTDTIRITGLGEPADRISQSDQDDVASTYSRASQATDTTSRSSITSWMDLSGAPGFSAANGVSTMGSAITTQGNDGAKDKSDHPIPPAVSDRRRSGLLGHLTSLSSGSVDKLGAVLTSANREDPTCTTQLESVVLGSSASSPRLRSDARTDHQLDRLGDYPVLTSRDRSEFGVGSQLIKNVPDFIRSASATALSSIRRASSTHPAADHPPPTSLNSAGGHSRATVFMSKYDTPEGTIFVETKTWFIPRRHAALGPELSSEDVFGTRRAN
jgi:hypothetical protein